MVEVEVYWIPRLHLILSGEGIVVEVEVYWIPRLHLILSGEGHCGRG